MSKSDDELQEILERFASNFAQKHTDEEEPYWWGHDTNLGTQSVAFGAAKRSIRAFKVRHMQDPRKFDTFKSMGYINRDALAKVVWGRSVPGWWKGSTAEFTFLQAVARARN